MLSMPVIQEDRVLTDGHTSDTLCLINRLLALFVLDCVFHIYTDLRIMSMSVRERERVSVTERETGRMCVCQQ